MIWHYLYDTKSGTDVGTLYHAREILNCRNVTRNPKDNFYATSDLLDRFTAGYLVTGALHYFGMNSTSATPTLNNCATDFTALSNEEKADYFCKEVLNFVRQYVLNPPVDLVHSRDFHCKYCKKMYKNKKALLRHESNHRQDLQDQTNRHKCNICGKSYVRFSFLEAHVKSVHEDHTEEENPQDFVHNYTRTTLMLTCLRLVFEQAIKYGNGHVVMLCYKYMLLYCKGANCPKYAYGMLETVAQVNALLSPRVAHDVTWNRFVNTKGKLDTNFPIDMYVEHCNKPLKLDASTFRGQLTDKTLQRISRSIPESEAIVKAFDRICDVHRPSGKHNNISAHSDIQKLVNSLNQRKVFSYIPKRSHRQFPQIPANPIASLDMKVLHKWLKQSIGEFADKHYYET